METPMAKRPMNHPLTPQNSNPDVASLATLGMRIRKAVADGYSTNPNNSYNSQFFENGAPMSQTQPQPSIQRVPFPEILSQPPSLTSAGSTFQSGSNVSEWGADVKVHTLPQVGVKRRLEDDDSDPWSKHQESPHAPHIPSYEEFCSSNGQLRFNEDF